MRRYSNLNSSHTGQNGDAAVEAPISIGQLPNRLLTAMEVAEYVGCHEETVRRAYWRRLLKSQCAPHRRCTSNCAARRARQDSAPPGRATIGVAAMIVKYDTAPSPR